MDIDIDMIGMIGACVGRTAGIAGSGAPGHNSGLGGPKSDYVE